GAPTAPGAAGRPRPRQQSVRGRRPQRPVSVREWEEVQEVSRGGCLSAERGRRNAEHHGRDRTSKELFRVPRSHFRVVSVLRYPPSPPTFPPCPSASPSTPNTTVPVSVSGRSARPR